VRDLLGFGAFSWPASKNDLCDRREESILAFLQTNAPKARCHADVLPFGRLRYIEVADATANAIGHAKF
jgi:hypothetical protein